MSAAAGVYATKRNEPFATDDVTVAGRDLLALVEEWLARGHRLYADLAEHHAHLIQELRRGTRARVGLDVADRLLIAMGMEYRLAEIAPPPRTSTSSRRQA